MRAPSQTCPDPGKATPHLRVRPQAPPLAAPPPRGGARVRTNPPPSGSGGAHGGRLPGNSICTRAWRRGAPRPCAHLRPAVGCGGDLPCTRPALRRNRGSRFRNLDAGAPTGVARCRGGGALIFPADCEWAIPAEPGTETQNASLAFFLEVPEAQIPGRAPPLFPGTTCVCLSLAGVEGHRSQEF